MPVIASAVRPRCVRTTYLFLAGASTGVSLHLVEDVGPVS